jgi:hypothetical protein
MLSPELDALLDSVTATVPVGMEPVRFGAAGTEYEGFFARPAGDVPLARPDVLVLHDWFGCSDHVRARMLGAGMKKTGQIPTVVAGVSTANAAAGTNAPAAARPEVSGPATPTCTPPSTATPAWLTPKCYLKRRPAPRSGSSAGPSALRPPRHHSHPPPGRRHSTALAAARKTSPPSYAALTTSGSTFAR